MASVKVSVVVCIAKMLKPKGYTHNLIDLLFHFTVIRIIVSIRDIGIMSLL